MAKLLLLLSLTNIHRFQRTTFLNPAYTEPLPILNMYFLFQLHLLNFARQRLWPKTFFSQLSTSFLAISHTQQPSPIR